MATDESGIDPELYDDLDNINVLRALDAGAMSKDSLEQNWLGQSDDSLGWLDTPG